MVFGYYGTSSYSSFNNLNYIRFLLAMDTISPDETKTFTHWSTGLLGYPLLSTFAGEKYVITNEPVPFQMAEQYEPIDRYEGVYLFRNKMYLPLGLIFESYLPEELFMRLPGDLKAETLIHAAILSSKEAAAARDVTQLGMEQLAEAMREISVPTALLARRAASLQIRSFQENAIDGTVQLDKKGLLLMQMPFDPGWRAWQDDRIVPVIEADAGLLGIPLDGGRHEVRLRYTPPLRAAGGFITLFALVLLSLSLYRWPRIKSIEQLESARS
jgi:uncharacterized membrane protein YfhO